MNSSNNAAPDIDTLWWYALGIPLYAVYVVAEILIARRRKQKVFGFAETISNLTAGLSTLVVGLFVGPWVMLAWTFVHDRIAPFPWPVSSDHAWWKLPAAIVLADFCYYAYHRAGHRFAIFWSIHGIHHQHEHLNSSVGFRLEWLADPYAAIFFGLMPLAGIDSKTGFLALAIVSFYALTAHTMVIPRPSLGIFVTPMIHGSHHSRDARFGEKNFGAMFSVWDRMFGTLREPAKGEELRTDAPSISRTHDGVRAQWGLILELVRSLARTKSLKEKIALLTSPPVIEGPHAPLRDDTSIDPRVRVYVLVQFLALSILGAWLLLFREERPLSVRIAIAVTLITGLYALGGLLDGRDRAMTHERARLVATAVIGVALTSYSPVVGGSMLIAALAGLLASFYVSTASLAHDGLSQ